MRILVRPSAKRSDRGFTLIELLIVVAIIGIIAAIVIPNLLDALQKSKQKRTIADVRNVGTAWMSWLVDQVGAASAGQGKTYDASGFGDVGYSELFGYLHPSNSFFYMQEVPRVDGWHYDLCFASSPNLLLDQVLVVGSGGQDGSLGDDCARSYDTGPFLSTDYTEDIVWADGYFLRWPENLIVQ